MESIHLSGSTGPQPQHINLSIKLNRVTQT